MSFAHFSASFPGNYAAVFPHSGCLGRDPSCGIVSKRSTSQSPSQKRVIWAGLRGKSEVIYRLSLRPAGISLAESVNNFVQKALRRNDQKLSTTRGTRSQNPLSEGTALLFACPYFG